MNALEMWSLETGDAICGQVRLPQGFRRPTSCYGGQVGATHCCGQLPPSPKPKRDIQGPIYVSTKRTHRFMRIFLMQHSRHEIFKDKTRHGNRWVRFGKRTQFRGVFGVVKTMYFAKGTQLWGGTRRHTDTRQSCPNQ